MTVDKPDSSLLHLFRKLVTPARVGLALRDKPLASQEQENQPPMLPAVTNEPAGVDQSDATRAQLSKIFGSTADELDVRFADTIANAEAATTEIADATEELLETEAQVESDQVESDSSSAVNQDMTPLIESPAGQGKSVSEEDVASVTQTGLAEAAHVPAENERPKSSKNPDEISRLILKGLGQIDGFPESGVEVTVYGFGSQWNAMLTFAPGSTTFAKATGYRKILPDLVAELRKQFDLM